MTRDRPKGSLQVSNRRVMNNLSTEAVDELWDNLWVNCGAPVDCPERYRIVKPPLSLMQRQLI